MLVSSCWVRKVGVVLYMGAPPTQKTTGMTILCDSISPSYGTMECERHTVLLWRSRPVTHVIIKQISPPACTHALVLICRYLLAF